MTEIDQCKEAFVVVMRNVVYSDAHDTSSDSEFDSKVSGATECAPIILGVFTSMALASQCLMHNSVGDDQIVEIVLAMVNQPKNLFSYTVKSHRQRKPVDSSSSSGGNSDNRS